MSRSSIFRHYSVTNHLLVRSMNQHLEYRQPMSQIEFHRLRNIRTKNIFVVVLFVAVMMFTNYTYYMGRGYANTFTLLALVFCSGIFALAFVLIPFRQMVQRDSNNLITTYRQVGPWKFFNRALGKLSGIELVQDEYRSYCITISTDTGKISLERYPTLDNANERLKEFREALILD